jgi:hypothetical protein
MQVTDEFREQAAPLDGLDLAALAAVVLELPGVGFFNSGLAAGASQRHRHLQVCSILREPLAGSLFGVMAIGLLVPRRLRRDSLSYRLRYGGVSRGFATGGASGRV